jgi:hypothetical protein
MTRASHSVTRELNVCGLGNTPGHDRTGDLQVVGTLGASACLGRHKASRGLELRSLDRDA